MNKAARGRGITGSVGPGENYSFWQAESVFILSFACVMAGFVLWINFQNILCSALLVAAGGLFYILCNTILIFEKQERKDHYLAGLLSVSNLLGILVCLRFLFKRPAHRGVSVIICVLSLCLFLLFMGGYLRVYAKRFKDLSSIILKNRMKALCLFAFFAFLIVINADIFDTWLRWDNYEYYRCMETITFRALVEKVSAFRICGHQTYALSLLVLIVKYITGSAIVTAYLLNFLYLIGGYICFMALMRKLFSGLSFAEIFLGSFLYALSPFFFGAMKCLNLEFYLAFSLLVYLAASAYDLRGLQYIGGFMLIFGKETGVVIMLAIMAANVLREIIELKSLKAYFRTKNFYFALMTFILGVLWLVDYKKHTWLASNAYPFETVDGSTFNAVGVSWVYIKDKLRVLFLSQFSWIFWIGITVFLCLWIIRKLQGKSYAGQSNLLKNKVWLEMLAAGIGCLFVNLLMITYNHYRYLSPLIPVLYLLFLRAVNILVRKKYFRCGIYCVISVLLFLQCFRTVDPVMKHFFVNLAIGEDAVLCSPPNNVIDFGAPFIGEVQYNRQIADFDRALDDLIGSIGYDDDTCIVISDEFTAKSANKNGYIGAVHAIGGYGYQYIDSFTRYVSWDQQNEKRYLSKSDKNEMHIVYLSSAARMMELKQQYGRVVYIKMPWQDNLYKNEIEALDLPETTVKYRGWELNAYVY